MDKQSGIENPSKSEVIGRCGGDDKTEWPRITDKSRTLKTQKQKQTTKRYINDMTKRFDRSCVCIVYQMCFKENTSLYIWRILMIYVY